MTVCTPLMFSAYMWPSIRTWLAIKLWRRSILVLAIREECFVPSQTILIGRFSWQAVLMMVSAVQYIVLIYEAIAGQAILGQAIVGRTIVGRRCHEWIKQGHIMAAVSLTKDYMFLEANLQMAHHPMAHHPMGNFKLYNLKFWTSSEVVNGRFWITTLEYNQAVLFYAQ